MKLSFTTLGCPNWTLDQVIEKAAEYGYDAIDFRGLNGTMDIYRLPEFAEKADDTHRRIQAAGLAVSCFSSSVVALSTANLEKNIEEVRAYAKLCELFGTRFIRVFGGKIGEMSREEAAETLARNLDALGRVADEHGARLVFETHDDWLDSTLVKAVFERLETKSVGVLWDVHHPYRMLGEEPETTWANLGPWIEYTHVKDSRGTAEDYSYCLTGEGDIPLQRICSVLQRGGYDGYYTFEWEKKWHPEIDEPTVALPQYVQYMRKLAGSIGA
jgi:sugar phosphate isomerase/epimerase